MDIEQDIVTLNENIDSNKKAVVVLKGSVVKVLQAMSVRREIEEERDKNLKASLAALEKKYDDKLSLYEKEYEKTVSQKLKDVVRNFDNKITELKISTGTLKNSLQKQIAELTCSPSNQDTDELPKSEKYLNSIKNLCEEIKQHHADISELKKQNEETFFASIGFKEHAAAKKSPSTAINTPSTKDGYTPTPSDNTESSPDTHRSPPCHLQSDAKKTATNKE